MIRAVLFDLDGVLIESRPLWFKVMNVVAAELGYAEISAERFARCWGQSVQDDVSEFYPRHSVRAIDALYYRRFPAGLPELVVNQEAAGVLAALAARQKTIAVVTNTPRALAVQLLNGLRHDVLVAGSDVPRPKPAPDMIVKACTESGVARSEAIVVGDTHYDRDAAAAAGVPFVGFGIAGDFTITRLSELPALVDAAS